VIGKAYGYAIGGVVGIALLTAAIFGLISHGRVLERADNNAAVALAAETSKIKQAQEQRAINDLASQYYNAVENAGKINTEITQLKNKLRGQHNATCDKAIISTDLPMHYQLFNSAASHTDLSTAGRTQEPDAARDGLDAIQYAASEANRAKTKVNALISIIKSSSCFK
jgi:hypothetical protein